VLALFTASGAPGAAQPNCRVAISAFRDIVNTEAAMGRECLLPLVYFPAQN
jgi:hypothetical protein